MLSFTIIKRYITIYGQRIGEANNSFAGVTEVIAEASVVVGDEFSLEFGLSLIFIVNRWPVGPLMQHENFIQ